jgi:hypothetical protein
VQGLTLCQAAHAEAAARVVRGLTQGQALHGASFVVSFFGGYSK